MNTATARAPLTQENLKMFVHYDPVTGVFTRVRSNTCAIRVGDVAGSLCHGYSRFRVDGTLYYAHRLAWLYVTGEHPTNKIDHIDTNRLNNKFSNLRQASDAENCRNKNKHKNNTTGFKGVTKCGVSKKNPWRAEITVNSKAIHLGLFKTALLAHGAYCEAAKKYHGVFARS